MIVGKLLFAMLLFTVIITIFVTGIMQGNTAAESANKVVNTNLFTQDCLDAGIETFACITPDEDRITGTLTDPYANLRWDGCPQDYPYMINYGGCEGKTQTQQVYCCTKKKPVTCDMQDLRICYSPSMKTDDVNPCLQDQTQYYDDTCLADCAQGGCEYYDPEQEMTGEYCETHYSCCGKTNNRACELDCPDDYPNEIGNPYVPGTPEYEQWGCNNERSKCCQK